MCVQCVPLYATMKRMRFLTAHGQLALPIPTVLAQSLGNQRRAHTFTLYLKRADSVNSNYRNLHPIAGKIKCRIIMICTCVAISKDPSLIAVHELFRHNLLMQVFFAKKPKPLVSFVAQLSSSYRNLELSSFRTSGPLTKDVGQNNTRRLSLQVRQKKHIVLVEGG